MFTRHWLKLTILLTLLLTVAGAATNAWLDIYGVFQDPKGKKLPVYGDERVAKYLLSTRYVGANFDGVLLGSSMSENWRLGELRSARLYNESVAGGNSAEQKVLFERVLESGEGGHKMVLMIVHPYLTDSHEFKTVTLTPREVYGALGSQSLLEAYKGIFKIRTGREKQWTDFAGTLDVEDIPKKLNPNLISIWKPGNEFAVDPIGLDLYRETVEKIHAQHIPLAFIIPPTVHTLLDPKAGEFARYTAKILAFRSPEDRLLDFSTEEFRAFREDEHNFTDGVHLYVAPAAVILNIIDEHMKTWIDSGWTQGR